MYTIIWVMKISQKVADILWSVAERYLASLTKEEQNQILSLASKNCVCPITLSDTEQTTPSTNS